MQEFTSIHHILCSLSLPLDVPSFCIFFLNVFSHIPSFTSCFVKIVKKQHRPSYGRFKSYIATTVSLSGLALSKVLTESSFYRLFQRQ